MRELSERSPAVAPRGATSDPPPIVEPSELRPRSSNPPAPVEDSRNFPSIPPDAVVPASPYEPSQADALEPVVPMPPTPQPPQVTLAELNEKTEVDADVEKKPKLELSMPKKMELSMPAAPPPAPAAKKEKEEEPHNKTPLSSAVKVNRAADAPKKKSSGGWLLFAALLGVAIVVGAALRWTMPSQSTGSQAQPTAPPKETATQLPTTTQPPPGVRYEDLPPGADVPPGEGLLVVTAPMEVPIRVGPDQKGRGPKMQTHLAPGVYDVRVGLGVREKNRLVEVRAGQATRVEMTDTP
jgi:hypothetical protein